MPAPALRVFTFKEGLLARVGHDLQLLMHRFTIALHGGEASGVFWLDSLRVAGAMRGAELVPELLSAADREKIERALRDEVLQLPRHPQAHYQGRAVSERDGAWRIDGELRLMGRQAPLSLEVHEIHEDGALLRATASFSPSTWGIRPYRALGGALKLQDRLRVVAELPRSGLTGDPRALASAEGEWQLPEP